MANLTACSCLLVTQTFTALRPNVTKVTHRHPSLPHAPIDKAASLSSRDHMPSPPRRPGNSEPAPAPRPHVRGYVAPTRFYTLPFPLPKSLRAQESLEGAAFPHLQPILVNRYDDSLTGSCAAGSHDCNLRAALREADIEGGGVDIYLPTAHPHVLTFGELSLHTSQWPVKIAGFGGVAVIEAGEGHKGRFLSVGEGEGAVELQHLIVRRFRHSEEGGAVLSHGALTLFHVGFDGNGGKRGGAVFNTGSLVVRECTFEDNRAEGERRSTAKKGKDKRHRDLQEGGERGPLGLGHDIFTTPKGSLMMDQCVPASGEGQQASVGPRVEGPLACLDSELVLSSGQSKADVEKAARMARDEGFEQTLIVNLFSDSMDGDCGLRSRTCNLRAAVGEAVSSGAPTLIYLPPAVTHAITKGPILIPQDAFVKVAGVSGLARVDGAANQQRRLFHVLADGYLELSDVQVTHFGAAPEGGAIRNEGELMLYRVAFASGHGLWGAAIFNLHTCSLWYSTALLAAGARHDMVHNERGQLYVHPCEEHPASPPKRVTGQAPLCVADLRKSAPIV